MRFPLLVLPLFLAASSLGAQPAPVLPDDDAPPPVAREFRGVWIATVGNMDWPSRAGLSTAQQQQELIALLDRAADLHLNAVIFQVRPAADALYDSPYEPWSQVLTGEQGRAPSPYWDPLKFIVEEGHRRGLEVHAWFNPFRAGFTGSSVAPARSSVVRRHPEWVKRYGPYLWMDPGKAAARERAIRVIVDVVRRYDVDGVHIDDYFYPYQERSPTGRALDFPDNDSYRAYRRSGGRLSRGDWRRRNVDRFVEALYTRVKATKRWVKVGISPFGIWRPGSPPSVTGLDAYTEIFADSRKWVRRGWADYFAPQIYWRVEEPRQRYPVLVRWWAEQNEHHRHLWIGNYTGRVGMAGDVGWSADDIVRQVEATRDDPGATGNVHFNMTALMQSPDSLDAKLAELYAAPALVPASPWLGGTSPRAPRVRVVSRDVAGRAQLRLEPGGDMIVRYWTVRSRSGGVWHTQILPATVRSYVPESGADRVIVTAVNRVGLESQPTVVMLVSPQAPVGR